MDNVGQKSTCGLSSSWQNIPKQQFVHYISSTSLTTSGNNCLKAVAQKEILHFHIWKQRKINKTKHTTTILPWFPHLSSEGLLRKPSRKPSHSTLCEAAVTPGAWMDHVGNIRAAPKSYWSPAKLCNSTMENVRWEGISTVVPSSKG